MPEVVVASGNPVKRRAAREAFRALFGEESFACRGAAVPSGVAHQPTSDKETLAGAEERARRAREAHAEADYWVGIEGGIEDTPHGMAAFAWVVVRSRTVTGRARSGTFFLPGAVADLVRAGHELGDADDRVFGRSNSKQEEGAVGLLTAHHIDRTALYRHATLLALIPFLNPELFGGGEEGEVGG